MDGNGRWAKKRGLPRILGHRAGEKAVRNIVETCAKLKIKILTLYAFSTENWARPKTEINSLMVLLKTYLRKELKNLLKNNIRLNVIGNISKLPQGTKTELDKVIKKTSRNSGLLLNLALNYGGRQEIVRAVNFLLRKKLKEIKEKDLSDNLYTEGIPDPDLFIRTSGEKRLSNFLLWQLAYSELYFTEVLWPDFNENDLYSAIIEYQRRNRRFGGI